MESSHFVVAVLLLGLLLRLAWVFAFPNEPFGGEELWHLENAKDLAQGRGYVRANGEPTAQVIIGYPLALSFVYRIVGTFGPHNLVAKLANVASSMWALGCTYALGRHWFQEKTARLGLLIMAFFPNQIAYNSLAATEQLYTVLFIGALAVLFTAHKIRWRGLILGILLGMATYVKSHTLGMFVVVFVCLWAVLRDVKSAAYHTGVALVITLALLTPWLIRNHRVFGAWVLVHGSTALLVGNNPGATGQHQRSPVVNEVYSNFFSGGQAEHVWDQKAKDIAVQFIRENPGKFAKLGLKKMYYMYHHDKDGIWHVLQGVTPQVSNFTWKFFSVLAQLYYVAVMFLTLGYLFHDIVTNHWRNIPNLGFLFVLFFSAVYFVFHAMPRYHFPLIPLFSLYAAQCLWTILGEPRTSTGVVART
jgi:hypothetical protein